MIPYLEIPSLMIGSVKFQPFGMLVATGVVVGSWFAFRRAREYGLEERFVRLSVWWVLITAFLTSHLVEVLVYYPDRVFSDPWLLLKFSQGISSFGGFFGGLLGLFVFTRIYKQPLARYSDVISLGLMTGWIFGRTGCFITHDHPGIRTDFFLAVAYPDGPRHDLGFYELIFTIVLFIVFQFVRRRPLAPGRIALLIGLTYAPVRFLLDFLRAYDVRYFYFTPAQYGSIALFLICSILIMRQQHQSAQPDKESSGP
jgi:phosphatidylglycerol:prolipoprotein diacylglycerol transferase